MKILNLYAGVGGNRMHWSNIHQVTSVEFDPKIASVYQALFPSDEVVVADAHEYLVKHFQEFDFIWSSPPCPTHSRASIALKGWNIFRYPDMSLFQEIIFLKNFFSGNWVVENVVPYYTPLIPPTVTLDRHIFWSNREICNFVLPKARDVSRATKQELAAHLGIELPPDTKGARKLLRNAVHPKLGQHILKSFEDLSQAA